MKINLKQVISFKIVFIFSKKVKIKCSYILAIKTKINSKTKNTQKFSSNLAKKTQNFVKFVNCKQKTKTHLGGNQSIQTTNASLALNINLRLDNFNID